MNKHPPPKKSTGKKAAQDPAFQAEIFFGSQGSLVSTLPWVTHRPVQEMMAHHIFRAFGQERIALVEAGTGTGKSMAYLVPALLQVDQGGRVVVSTHTIPLQEQILHKDLPDLKGALDLDLEAVLVKGMSNYLCLRKLQDTLEEGSQTDKESEAVEQIEAWSKTTRDGSLSDLSFVPNQATWERVSAESDACGNRQCPYYKPCFFFKARRQVENAKALIVNHHILMADLASRLENEEGGILPPYDYLVIDEAHHLEDVATDALAVRLSRGRMIRLLNRLAADKRGGGFQGKFFLLRERLMREEGKELQAVITTLELDLVEGKRELQQLIQEFFAVVTSFAEERAQGRVGESKLRLEAKHLEDSTWQESIVPAAHHLAERMSQYAHQLEGLDQRVINCGKEEIVEKTRGVRLDIQSVGKRLQQLSHHIGSFVFEPLSANEVRWIEANRFQVQLVMAKLDVSEALATHLFSPRISTVLTSATLATQGSEGSFSFLRRRLGLKEELPVDEAVFPSPFPYRERVLFAVPNDMPLPKEKNFTDQAIERIEQLLIACGGDAFVLFTSFQMLKACRDRLEEKLKKEKQLLFCQGDGDRQTILHQFKQTPHSVLFGTDSFWEGVDVVGDALKTVILVKLPFRVPSEPLMQARLEVIEAAGGNPFREYSLPQAIVKFKQGFGRLMRQPTDRGAIICLDRRLVTQHYGRFFLEALPPCRKTTGTTPELVEQVAAWLKKTR